MRRLLLAAALAAAGCGAPPAADPEQEFVARMKFLDAQLAALRHEPATARDRLAKMRRAAGECGRLPYRAVQAENRDLAFRFAEFATRMDALAAAPWAGETTWIQVDRLCSSCHEGYRVE